MNNIRQVSGLQWSEPTSSGTLPKPRSIAAKNGIAYQKKVGRALTSAAIKINSTLLSDPWFRFYDDNGRGQIVPDFILEMSDLNLIIEVKYTFTQEGVNKLQYLYMPVVKAALSKFRVRPLLICRNLIPAKEMIGAKIISKLGEALLTYNAVPVLQYLGQGAI